jgi:hypothetical protein
VKTFTIGQDLEIDIRRHVRVDGSRFPTPSPEYIADYFIITARWQGQNIDFYPNQGRPVDPLAVGWVGKKVVIIRDAGGNQIGTKRGADFRHRMFKMLAHRLGKAVLARQLDKTVAQITDADIAATNANSRLGRALRGTFVDPVDLTQFSLDDACRHLRDAEGDLEEGEKPPGTVANIDADFDSVSINGAAENEAPTNIIVGQTGASPVRAQFRFPLAAISAGSTVNDSSFQARTTASGSGSPTVDVHAYGSGGGDTDPNGNNAATKYTNTIAGTKYVAATTAWGTLSGVSATVDLGATADADIQGNISSPGFIAIGLRESDDGPSGNGTILEGIANAGSDPATLIVDYTEGAGGGTGRSWYGKRGWY